MIDITTFFESFKFDADDGVSGKCTLLFNLSSRPGLLQRASKSKPHNALIEVVLDECDLQKASVRHDPHPQSLCCFLLCRLFPCAMDFVMGSVICVLCPVFLVFCTWRG